LAQFCMNALHRGQHVARMSQQRLAGGRRLDAAAAPRQQRHADAVLERSDALADRRRDNRLAFRGARDVSLVANRDEHAQRHRIEIAAHAATILDVPVRNESRSEIDQQSFEGMSKVRAWSLSYVTFRRKRVSNENEKTALPAHVVIREVGLRDGLQSIATILPTAKKMEWIRDAHAAGMREIEVGSFVPARLLPQLAD